MLVIILGYLYVMSTVPNDGTINGSYYNSSTQKAQNEVHRIKLTWNKKFRDKQSQVNMLNSPLCESDTALWVYKWSFQVDAGTARWRA